MSPNLPQAAPASGPSAASSGAPSTAHASPADAAASNAPGDASSRARFVAPQRRRIYLMRHGSVDYFTPEGRPIRPDSVPLNSTGRHQADVAGALFAQSGVRFDRVVVSGLPRTVETAQRVLAASGHADAQPQAILALQEIRPGNLQALSGGELLPAFLGAFLSPDEDRRFLGGERVGDMLDRVMPAFESLLDDATWQCMLLVLHGGVNRALLSYAMTGRRGFLGGVEQHPACINVLDVADEHPMLPEVGRHFIVRGINLAPTQWLHADDRLTTMERLLGDFIAPTRR